MERVESLEAVARIWSALEARGCSHFFHSWTWVGSWLSEVVLGETPVWLWSARDSEGIVAAAAVLTLQDRTRLRGRIRTRQIQANESLAPGLDMAMAYNGLLVAPGLEAVAWRAFLEGMGSWEEEWDELNLCAVSASDLHHIRAARGDLRLRLEKSFPTWVVDLAALPSPRTDPLVLFKRKSRQQLRQSRRALAGRGSLSLHVASSRREAHETFDRLGLLHTQRWQAAGERGSFANPRWVRFHRRIIETGFDRGVVQLLDVRCGAELIGCLYGHLFRDTVFMHQTGFRSSDDNRLRPAHVSHVEAMRYNAERGMRRYDFLPDEPSSYKRFFAAPGTRRHWVQLQRPRLRFGIERGLRSMRDRVRSGDDA